ncbi:MAG: exodeoxyribonuclease VII large subunit [Acholeplasmataceae bacterium]|jgi:exodeoxyribonuclease VII large subunit|nr:exodeoxyribonuclease VII large subunit [Acholeplasmataceae bacterium]
MSQNQVYLTVSALNKYIKDRLERLEHLQAIFIKGEISNYTKYDRGNAYFTLKDGESQIKAIMFSRDASDLAFSPKEGDNVLVEAKINVYVPRGEYSLIVTKMTLDGIGELYLKYEQLKNALEEQGYFDPKHKKPIPKFPKRIGVVTSPSGAVIQDILNTVNSRYRLTEIILYPSLVQGDGAKYEIANQIKRANREKLVDVLIVGRGGGSIEDLWAFNEIEVIEAIFKSDIPVISAIGHETDTTISDFVSSLRVPTPTAAAVAATPNEEDLKQYLIDQKKRMLNLLNQKIENYELAIIQLEKRLNLQSPDTKIKTYNEKFDQLINKMHREMAYLISEKKNKLSLIEAKIISPKEMVKSYQERLNYLNTNLKSNIIKLYQHKEHQYQIQLTKLNSLNPLKTLEKGFGVITKEQKLIRSVSDVNLDDTIDIEIIDGTIRTKVIEKREKNGKE